MLLKGYVYCSLCLSLGWIPVIFFVCFECLLTIVLSFLLICLLLSIYNFCVLYFICSFNDNFIFYLVVALYLELRWLYVLYFKGQSFISSSCPLDLFIFSKLNFVLYFYNFVLYLFQSRNSLLSDIKVRYVFSMHFSTLNTNLV